MADDASPWRSPDTPASKGNGRGCRRGCLLSGLAVFALIMVFGGGVGLPSIYWHHLGDVQALEGPDRVILFVEIERVTRRPGFLQEGSPKHTAAFLRIDIFPDGRVERKNLQSNPEDDVISFKPSRYAVAYLADSFYLVGDPWMAPRPAYRLGPDRIDRLSRDEANQIVSNNALHNGAGSPDMSRPDAVSAESGWKRLYHEDDDDGRYPSPLGLINSMRHRVKLWQVGRSWDRGTPQSIVAESLPPANRWTRTLLEMKRQPWKSYKGERNRAYLREQYAADPER